MRGSPQLVRQAVPRLTLVAECGCCHACLIDANDHCEASWCAITAHCLSSQGRVSRDASRRWKGVLFAAKENQRDIRDTLAVCMFPPADTAVGGGLRMLEADVPPTSHEETGRPLAIRKSSKARPGVSRTILSTSGRSERLGFARKA
jgi:hypothetical protein